MSSILNIGELVVSITANRDKLKSEVAAAEGDLSKLQDSIARRLGTSPFSQYIADIRSLADAFTTGKMKADEYALGLERSFQRMHRAIGGPIDAARGLASAAAPATPFTPEERRDRAHDENDRLYGMTGEKAIINHREYIARAAQIQAQYQQELEMTPEVLQRRQQLNAAMSVSNALDQRGEQLKVQFATAQERHNLRMAEYNQLLAAGRISRELFNRAEKDSLDIQRLEAAQAGGRGLFGRSGGMLMMQGSYAIQDFATVLSMKGMGVGDAMRAASNNIGMMAMMIGGPSGSIVAALATLGSIAPGLWEKFGGGAQSSKESVEKLASSFERMRMVQGKLSEYRTTMADIAGADSSSSVRGNMKGTDKEILEYEELYKTANNQRDMQREFVENHQRAVEAREQARAANIAAGLSAGETGIPDAALARQAAIAQALADKMAGHLLSEDDLAARKEEEEKYAKESAELELKIANARAARAAMEKRLAELLEKESRVAEARGRSRDTEERENERRRIKNGVNTKEDAEDEIKRKEEELAKSDTRLKRLEHDRRIALVSGKPEDVVAIDQEIAEEKRKRQRTEDSIANIQARKGGLASRREMDEDQRREEEFLDTQKRNRHAANPRLADAQDIKDQLDRDMAAIERARPPGAERDAAIAVAKQGALKKLGSLANEGEEKKGSFRFSDPESFHKSIQTALKGDDMVKVQKETLAEQKATKTAIEALASAIKEMNTGLQ